MGRLLIVSNRLPITVEKRKGSLQFNQSPGGLATGLASFYESYDSIWIGWPGIIEEKITKEERREIHDRLTQDNCYPVFLTQSDVDKYYLGFSNKTLWPLFHYFTQYVIHDKTLWEAYKQVNGIFGEVISRIAEKDDIIWVHDYHLLLLPRIIREMLPEVAIGFFNHIPFPSFEIFRLLPWREEILVGLLGSDLIGFHTDDYTRHFLSSVHRLLGYEYHLGEIHVDDRIIRVDTFPMGIAYERFSKSIQDPQVQKEITKFHKKLPECKLVLSVDRLDYTKGIPERLKIYNAFLERNPAYREKVILILVSVPSRSQVEHYKLLKSHVDELVGRINGTHGTIGWAPIWYLYRSLPFHALSALYNIADVCLVTPLRDGMNLIAKEYISAKSDGRGVLILSEMTGAAKELGEAIIVNPNNSDAVVTALEKALTMPEGQQIASNRIMQERLQRYDVVRWAKEFREKLIQTKKRQEEMHARVLSPEMRKKLLHDYAHASRRLLLLDYDGTLIPFFGTPEEAQPGGELIRLLTRLSRERKNEVVLLSGRTKETLEEWFGPLDIGLVAEHGVWLKEKNWELIEPLTEEWKQEIRPILELYRDRTPGVFVEEKEFSLVWHYRKASPELSNTRVRELIDELVNFTANLNLQILEGSKVVEIKNSGINKGRAALRWIAKEPWGFLMSVGDDRTDEDVFEVIPERGYSLKVGLHSSLAKFNLKSHEDVLLLLADMT